MPAFLSTDECSARNAEKYMHLNKQARGTSPHLICTTSHGELCTHYCLPNTTRNIWKISNDYPKLKVPLNDIKTGDFANLPPAWSISKWDLSRMGASGSIRNPQTAKKFNQNRKPYAKPSKTTNFHIQAIKTLIDPIHWWQKEHIEVSRLFGISGGA